MKKSKLNWKLEEEKKTQQSCWGVGKLSLRLTIKNRSFWVSAPKKQKTGLLGLYLLIYFLTLEQLA